MFREELGEEITMFDKQLEAERGEALVRVNDCASIRHSYIELPNAFKG